MGQSEKLLKKVFYSDFGCRLNQFETRVLENTGNHIASSLQNADVIVINTCTVTGRADMKNRQAIRKAMSQNPNAEIIVTGCYASTDADSIKKMGDKISIVPNNLKFTIPDLISKQEPSKEVTLFPPARQKKESSARAYLKIQDGCNKKCSYCKIPLARGSAVSRDFSNAISEVKNLVDDGFKEIILTGVNVGHFKSNGKNIKDLFHSLCDIRGDHFYRLSSVEPECIDEELIEIISTKHFARFIHVPLQSGSNKILKSMRRGYTFETFAEKIRMIRRFIPDIHIGTDIMAGFPGETEEDFQQSLVAIRRLKFSNVHVFPFSKRPGSEIDNRVKDKSSGIKEINGKIIKDRVKEIISIQSINEIEYIKKTSGTVYRSVIDNIMQDHLEVVTENYIRGKVYINPVDFKKGDMVNVVYDNSMNLTAQW
jgi:threonylcarbamoyladenosine tRNA methylthiotransferase MtaB